MPWPRAYLIGPASPITRRTNARIGEGGDEVACDQRARKAEAWVMSASELEVRRQSERAGAGGKAVERAGGRAKGR
jgi:hypothetical protein